MKLREVDILDALPGQRKQLLVELIYCCAWHPEKQLMQIVGEAVPHHVRRDTLYSSDAELFELLQEYRKHAALR